MRARFGNLMLLQKCTTLDFSKERKILTAYQLKFLLDMHHIKSHRALLSRHFSMNKLQFFLENMSIIYTTVLENFSLTYHRSYTSEAF